MAFYEKEKPRDIIKPVIKVKETKEQKFKRVGTKRVKKAIIQLRLVKQIISSKSYSMNEEQLKTIVDSFNKEILDIKNAYVDRSKLKKTDDIILLL